MKLEATKYSVMKNEELNQFIKDAFETYNNLKDYITIEGFDLLPEQAKFLCTHPNISNFFEGKCFQVVMLSSYLSKQDIVGLFNRIALNIIEDGKFVKFLKNYETT